MKKFRFPEDGDVAQDICDRDRFRGDLLDIYAGNEGGKVHIWHHYLPLYDRYFGQYRDTPVRFLEIGVKTAGPCGCGGVIWARMRCCVALISTRTARNTMGNRAWCARVAR